MNHKTKQGALKAARDALGDEAIEGIDFSLTNTGAGWGFTEIPPANENAVEAQAKRFKVFREGKIHTSQSNAGLVNVKDGTGAEVWVKDGEPCVFEGVLYPNKTRATAARRAKVRTESKVADPSKRTKKPSKAAPEGAKKSDVILAMLKRPEGATSKQIEDAVHWQPHSVRGFLGTLRKQGVAVISTKEAKEPTVYRVVEEDVV